MEKLVYLFCAFMNIGCAVLLLRSYFRERVKLVFWGAIFFVCFALSNVVLFIDLGLLPPEIDLSVYRDLLTIVGLALLIYGLMREGNRV